jgi:hypothetical protein
MMMTVISIVFWDVTLYNLVNPFFLYDPGGGDSVFL